MTDWKEKGEMMEILIKRAKENTVEHIRNLQFTGGYTKDELIAIFKAFENKDFCCFADDGNTYLSPEIYYKRIAFVDVKKDYEKSTRFLLNCHSFNGELGVRLLKCCKKCRDLFLELIFKDKVYEELQKNFQAITPEILATGGKVAKGFPCFPKKNI